MYICFSHMYTLRIHVHHNVLYPHHAWIDTVSTIDWYVADYNTLLSQTFRIPKPFNPLSLNLHNLTIVCWTGSAACYAYAEAHNTCYACYAHNTCCQHSEHAEDLWYAVFCLSSVLKPQTKINQKCMKCWPNNGHSWVKWCVLSYLVQPPDVHKYEIVG